MPLLQILRPTLPVLIGASLMLTLEAVYAFRDGEAVRKRWVRLLYQGRTQVRLVAQAASVDGYAYWEPMFYEAMRTVRFGDWFA